MSDLSTPRRSKRSRDNQSNPATPTCRSARGKADAPCSQRDVSSPPSQKRKVDTSDLDLMPSSLALKLRSLPAKET
ncbi:hypothetical protein LSH36_1949g00022 [Paralvinella palmiformis]|uniref:Uncharacterized protein n=1 Tax=Paralvinella palmiformis TaxID=53620 RepID=A0AAD9MQG4_9ANNE|nr:hypothetical protein LSH36_3009g00000 [Paralvinella palmiformis]KAK2138457.1 hypothetical protein LSH36_3009g00001 [Paralvinella palmiformis]KAK2139190.1 hypothetical protein LSH36_1949g00018 [Paralvinella palmiformis]KAK2139191.1 hypothetical protein LSH36_1949g00019 [Paralvinella palmiformis]KAK2139192.1 hypothetical protein LSH36_1949g00020 [Paralvinella palmiformis]